MTKFCYNSTQTMRRGQALLEYALSVAALLVVVGILFGIIGVLKSHAQRTEALVTSDCP